MQDKAEYYKYTNKNIYKVANTTCRTCSLILVADYEFYRDVGEGSIKKERSTPLSSFFLLKLIFCIQTVHSMLYHVRQANLLMRSSDFNNDGHSDCVGVHVQDIRILTDPRLTVEDSLGTPDRSNGFANYWTWSRRKLFTPEDYIRMFSK